MFQKLFTSQQLKKIDLATIKKQGISSEQLMEHAATKLFIKIKKRIQNDSKLIIFCGTGNNGGDGLVLARLFYNEGYKVKCIVVPFSKNTSPDFDSNLHKLMKLPVKIEVLEDNTKLKSSKKDVLIDAVFGTGLSRPASGIAQKAIKLINRSKSTVFSIDVPSGLYTDKSNNKTDAIVKADIVYTIQMPKISFFFFENAQYIRRFKVVKIGLDKSTMRKTNTSYYYVNSKVLQLLKPREKFAYKNIFGHAMILGGSFGMIGSVALASKAALRIGAGLVTSFTPRKANKIMQIVVPEAMNQVDKNKKIITEINISKSYNAIGIGMGMGTHRKTVKAFAAFVKKQKVSMVIDADAINILAKHRKILNDIPRQTILTPHIGEFSRLAGTWKNDTEKWQKLLQFSQKYNCIVVLKGAYTTICDGKSFYINSIANPALATAGSGDVLTGIITGLLAQNYAPIEAAILGVYLHSKTADNYTKKYTSFSMIASDIIKELKCL